MVIEYFGHSCFRVTNAKGISWLSDPYTKVGYELPQNLTADFVTVSHAHFDHNAVHKVECDKVFDTLGTFAWKDVALRGVVTDHDEKGGTLRGKNIVYIVEMDGITLCHLGDIGQDIDETFLKALGKVDVLMLPIGGPYTIDATTAKAYVDAIAPKIVLPMHYKPLDGNIDITTEQPFLSLFDGVERLGAKKWVCDTKGILSSNLRVVFMERL